VVHCSEQAITATVYFALVDRYYCGVDSYRADRRHGSPLETASVPIGHSLSLVYQDQCRPFVTLEPTERERITSDGIPEGVRSSAPVVRP